ncbi:hypothetical protein [Streptomyces sp. NPDC019224]|uniref:hypothetical protein n=1 Tax=Streptomyces sp. NPDC019224 TaxID=3154484 RepID=UPI0033C40FAE
MKHAGNQPIDPEPPDPTARPPLVRELLRVVGLFLIHKPGRRAADGHVHEAFRDGDRERAARLPGKGVARLLLPPALTPFAVLGTAGHHRLGSIAAATLLPAAPAALPLRRAEPVRPSLPRPSVMPPRGHATPYAASGACR